MTVVSSPPLKSGRTSPAATPAAGPLAPVVAVDRRMFLIAAVLLAINLAIHFPGQMNPDATGQYMEVLSGKFTDWHPPVMVALWSVFRRIADGPATMLVFQLALHWLGFALIADSLYRQGRTRSAYWMLAAGAFPMFLLFNGGIWKDVGMASALIAGFAICRWYRSQNRRMPVLAVVAALAFLSYGTLVRTNAVFAAGPLVIYLWRRPVGRPGFITLLSLAALISVLAMPVSSVLNKHVFLAEPSGAMRSLQIFDLSGIASRTGDVTRLQALNGGMSVDVSRCHSSYWWDSYSPWGPCRQVWEGVARSEQAVPGTVTKAWVTEIAQHPVPYVLHRLAYFNSMLYWLVPVDHHRLTPALTGMTQDPAFSYTRLAVDLAKRNPAFWPAIWIVLGVGCLLLLGRRAASEDNDATRALVLSGLLYTGAYLMIGVATSMRYHYWLVMACLVGMIIGLPPLRAGLLRHDRTVRATLAVAAVVLVAGLATRVFDITFLVR